MMEAREKKERKRDEEGGRGVVSRRGEKRGKRESKGKEK